MCYTPEPISYAEEFSTHPNHLPTTFSQKKPHKLPITRIILGMHSANERCCHNVTLSLIAWTDTQNDSCIRLSCGMPMVNHNYNFNTLRPRQNGRHFPDAIFQWIFLNENIWISHKIPLKFVPRGPINNIPALVQIMAWRRPGDKPLSEPMLVFVPTHICVTRPEWVKFHPRTSVTNIDLQWIWKWICN